MIIKKLNNLFKVSQVVRAEQGFKPRKPDSRVCALGSSMVQFSNLAESFFPLEETAFGITRILPD